MNFISFLQENLSHVLPVLLAGAFGLAIIIERTRALYGTYTMKDSKSFFSRIQEFVLAGKIEEANKLCDENPEKPITRVVKSALSRAHLPIEAVEQGIQLTLSECSQLVQKRTAFLATIANVATLMGLFGTIAGLIFSFEAVGHADPQQKSALLSAGIATAMNATMLGLAVAIPCMVAFALLVSKSNKLLAEMEEAAARSVDALKLRYYSADFQPAAGEEARTNGHASTSALRRAA